MTITDAAALIFALVAAGSIAFQFALAFGAPWGAYALGGRFPGTFPTALRIAAILQAAAIALLAVIVLSTAGLVLPSFVEDLPWVSWVPVVFSAVSLVANAASPSPGERRIWTPVAVVLLVSSLTVLLTTR